MTIYIVLAIITAISAFILFVPVGIGAKYENGAFAIFKIAFFSFEIPVKKTVRKKSKSKKNDGKKPDKEKIVGGHFKKCVSTLDFVLSVFGDFRRFVRKRVSLSNFDMTVKVGTANAASTAVCTGHLWSLSYNILSLIDKIVYVDNPKVDIVPMFNEATFSVSVKGIIKTRIAHIIAAAIVFAYKFLKYKKNKTRRKTV